jgi:hypothetical protein
MKRKEKAQETPTEALPPKIIPKEGSVVSVKPPSDANIRTKRDEDYVGTVISSGDEVTVLLKDGDLWRGKWFEVWVGQ